MKKTIYTYFFNEFIRYFIIVIFTLAAITWTVQAVNLLDLVTDDGHAFGVYFLYSSLTLVKIVTKLFPFSFLIATLLTISKFEKDNELIILWTSGLNKIHIVNLVFRISLIIMIVQLVLSSIINPISLNYGRSLVKNSQLQFIPSLLIERQFNDTVKGLTIFVDEKEENGSYKNIFIRDDGKILTNISNGASTIFAKSGYISKDDKNLILINGNIQRSESDGTINIITFAKTSINLSGLSTKTISDPKIQEISTYEIIRCMILQFLEKDTKSCRYGKNYTDTKIEINKRLGMPFYIPLISLVCCFLLSTRRDKKISYYNNYIYFFISFIILVISEISVRYSGVSWTYTALYYIIPILLIPVFYFLLIKTFKYENLEI
jgi:lipopolysaccharide export system permease protein